VKANAQGKAIIEGQSVPGYMPPASAHEVEITTTPEGGVELGYYSTFDKAMNGMLDEQ
jgi:hypothetical protein